MPTLPRSQRTVVKRLLQQKGLTYANEAGIDLEKNTPAVLFQHLYMSLLLSARISAANALEATRALIQAGLATPQKMSQATRVAWPARDAPIIEVVLADVRGVAGLPSPRVSRPA